MDRSVVQSELVETEAQLDRVRQELAETDERLVAASALVDQLRLRAFTSETPQTSWQTFDAEVQLEALIGNRENLALSLLELRAACDRLIAKLSAQ